MEQNELLIEILELIRSEKSNKEIKEQLDEYHESDIADVVPLLSDEERGRLFAILDTQEISEMFPYLDDVEEYIEEMEPEQVADIIELMDADDAIDILEELDEEDQQEILDLVEDEELVKDIELIQGYEDDEIGSKMTTNFIQIKQNILVKDAMKHLINEAPENDNIMTLYVVDKDDKFYGSVELKELIIARKEQPVDNIVYTGYPFVYAKEKIDDCITKIKDYGLQLIPVLDEEDHIIGVITSDDIIEVVDEEMGEDYARLAGLSSEEDLSEPIGKSIKKRFPWLLMLLILGMVISILISGFEEAISNITVVVFFQSMILGMAGNCGTQSLAVTIRVLTDEEITNKKLFKMLFKEFRVGLLNGLILGSISFVTVFAFLYLTHKEIIVGSGFNIPDVILVSGIIAFSLFAAMTIASLVGTTMPILFKKMKIDPAVASGPFITTVNDVVAVVVYYGLCTLFFLTLK